MGVYTKTGDKGMTSLFTGQRVSKGCLRVEAYGTVDELNAALGMARALCQKAEVKENLFKLQKMNMSLMAELASVGGESYITAEHITVLEQTIDAIEKKLPPLKAFLIAGSTQSGAAIDMARTIARRAERCLWRLRAEETISETLLIALNRLSDLCFMLMRLEEEDV